MRLFAAGCDGKCPVSLAKDAEIVFLRDQVKTLTDKLTNMVDPMLQARLAMIERGRAPQPVGPQKPQPKANARLIAMRHPDKPTQQELDRNSRFAPENVTPHESIEEAFEKE